ncbi:MAG: DUF998 domain-containing protein [Thermoplasmatota archaeon]
MDRRLLIVAYAAAWFFLAAIAFADAGTPGQEPTRDTISDLVHGPRGWAVEAAFVLHGLGDVVLGLALMRAAAGRQAWWGGALVAANGVALALLAAFPVNPPGHETWVGTAHLVLASVAFIGLGAGIQATTWQRRRGRDVLNVLAVVAGAALVWFAAVLWGDLPGLGLAERAVAVANTTWVLAVTRRLWVGRPI